MAIVDLVDHDGYLIGRDKLGIETEQTIRDGYVMQIRDGDAAIHVIPVPLDNLPMLDPNIPLDPETADIFDIGAVI